MWNYGAVAKVNASTAELETKTNMETEIVREREIERERETVIWAETDRRTGRRGSLYRCAFLQPLKWWSLEIELSRNANRLSRRTKAWGGGGVGGIRSERERGGKVGGKKERGDSKTIAEVLRVLNFLWSKKGNVGQSLCCKSGFHSVSLNRPLGL